MKHIKALKELAEDHGLTTCIKDNQLYALDEGLKQVDSELIEYIELVNITGYTRSSLMEFLGY